MSYSETIRIARPFDEVADLLEARPAAWVEPFVRIAAHAGEAAAARSLQVTPPPGSRELHVELPVATPRSDPDALVVSIRWRTGGFSWVPPSYAGRIVLRRASYAACEMTFEGSYALPPSVRDRSGAETTSIAAQAMVATFLRSFRAAVEEQAREIV